MEKRKEIALAKKRRSRLLAEFTRTGWTKKRLADKYGISCQRVGKLLKMAMIEHDT